MANLHQVIDSRGKLHKRVSQGRLYAFAIVAHYPPSKGSNGHEWPEHTSCAWASRRDLAESQARQRRTSGADHVEIIPTAPIQTRVKS